MKDIKYKKAKKLSKKEEKELQNQFPQIEEKASKFEIISLVFWFLMLLGSLYVLYLSLTYRTIVWWNK